MNITLSDLVPLDVAISLMHIIRQKTTDYTQLSELDRYIFVKEVAKESSPIQFCIFVFCEDDELKNNEELYTAYQFIKDYIYSVYNPAADNGEIEYQYEKVVNSPSLSSEKDHYDVKNIYLEPHRIQRNLQMHWNLLTDDQKLRWILLSFVSLDYQLIFTLNNYNGHQLSFIKRYINSEELNAIFELMLINYVFSLNFEMNTVYSGALGIQFIYGISKIKDIDDLLRERLNKENLKTYNDLLKNIEDVM